MTTRNEKRPWLAVVLAFLYPGLGHLYLREWLRALVWFFLVVTSSTLLIPEGTPPREFSLDALVRFAEQIPLTAALAILAITVFSMVDAYWVAKQGNQRASGSEGTTCPNCGKDVDPDLDFCHWCTERIPDADADVEPE